MPSPEMMPEISYALAGLEFPRRMNCAAVLLDEAVERGWGKRVAFYCESGDWTYEQLREKANRIARVLTEDCGLVPGNRVLLRGPNHPMLAACWFGVLKAGGVVVCTPCLLRAREITSITEKAKVSIALTDARFAADCEEALGKSEDGSTRSGARVLRFNGETGHQTSLECLMARKSGDFRPCDTSAEDTAIIAFTSGTTGKSKGTMHTHRDIIAATELFPRHVLRPKMGDIFIGTPPLAFTYALGGLLIFPLRVGAGVALLETGTPAALLQGIERWRATVVFTAPTAYRAMLKDVTREKVRSLRKCVSAGEPLPVTTFEAWERATGVRIIDGIGSTEMLHIFISAREEEARPGSTGKVVPGYEAKILREDGGDAAPGEVGKLAVRGATGCKYLDDPEQQRKYVQNGWNLTGDSFRMDEDGYFWFQARTDELIVSSGYNISGIEVEQVLLEHHAVQECAVVGAPDADRGQIVKAFVVLSAAAEGNDVLKKELQDFVKSQIAPFKYPRAIEFVSALPKTTTGKLQRHQLVRDEVKR